MVAQDPSRLSEALLAWESQMTKVWVLLAYSSLTVRLSEQAISKFWAKFGVSRLSDFKFAWCPLMVRLSERANFQSWAGKVSLAWANGLLAWASVHLGRFQLRFLKPYFIQKPNFNPPITQIDLQKCFQVLYTAQHHKQFRKTQLVA